MKKEEYYELYKQLNNLIRQAERNKEYYIQYGLEQAILKLQKDYQQQESGVKKTKTITFVNN